MGEPPPQQISGPAKRVFGFWICLAIVIGNMIGSGFFLMPASLAPFGWNGVAGWVVTTAGALCLAVVFANLARNFPEAGGPYAYSSRAFGSFVGFLVAWGYWISMWIGNVAIATGVVAPLSAVFPVITPYSPLFTLALVWSLTAINCFGARTVGQIQLVTTILKFLPLAAVILVATLVLGSGGGDVAPALRSSDLRLGGEMGIAAAAALTLWSFLGLETATVPAERVENPSRNIPRATLIGVAITGAIYTFACSAVALLMPVGEVANSGAPMADFIGLYWGGPAFTLIALFAAISAFGTLNGWVMMQGELPWAMAKDGNFPGWFAKLSRRGTPARAHVLASLLLTAVMLANYSLTMTALFEFVILIAVTISLVMYLVCALAAIRLGTGGRLVPIFLAGALFSVSAMWGAGKDAVIWSAVLLATGVPAYLLMRLAGRSSPAAAAPRAAPPESSA